MLVDASALCAILTKEKDAEALAERMQDSASRITSPLAVWETVVSLTRISGQPLHDVRVGVDHLLATLGIELREVPSEAAALALQAFDRLRKGRHPAALNFGDCFAYACARHFGTSLLYKGEDFAKTDIEPA